MNTNAHTTTMTVTGTDVRQVATNISIEVQTLCQSAAHVARDFDAEQAILDCSLLLLNDVITAIKLQFYLSDELVREHSYEVVEEALELFGPEPDDPPIGYLPQGARVRLVAVLNSSQADDYCEAWMRRLGWQAAHPIEQPADAVEYIYGTFCSGDYGVERRLLVNPRYDRPVTDHSYAAAREYQP